MSDDGSITRSAHVSADDSRGFWLVTADGAAGTWHACSRSLDVAVSLATYASMIGETPRDEWHAPDSADDVQNMIAPYSFAWDSSATAIANFKVAELVWTAAIRGTYLPAQPYVLDAELSDDEWRAVELGAYVTLSDGDAAVMSETGGVHRVNADTDWTDCSGSILALSKSRSYGFRADRRYVYDRSTDTFVVLLSVDSKSRATIYTAYGAVVTLACSELSDDVSATVRAELPTIDHVAIEAALDNAYGALNA